MGDELWFYYGGWDGPHNSVRAKANIGLAKLRLDGFCSMHAGDEEGWPLSRREPLWRPRVMINAKAAAGSYVVAELLDPQNNVLPGFSRKDCVPFTGDSVRHVLEWKREKLPDDQIDPDKKIRFYLKNADLYSHLPDQSTKPQVVIYVPVDNGGLLPNDEKIPASQRFTTNSKPSGFRMAKEGDFTCLDLHSVAADKTTACFSRNADWTDVDNWCLEAWYRVLDQGTEPNYGLATPMRPDSGRNAALHLSETSVGINTTEDTQHKTLKTVDMDTTDRYHWCRLVHTGGAEGELTLFVDGKDVIRMPFADLALSVFRGHNITFAPKAAQREGRLRVAKFGYRIGSTEELFGAMGG